MLAHTAVENHEKTHANGTVERRVFLRDDTFDTILNEKRNHYKNSHVRDNVNNSFVIVNVLLNHIDEYEVLDTATQDTEEVGP